MKTNPAPSLVEFDPARLDELVLMWRTRFEAGVGITDPHPIAEQRQAFLDRVLPQNDVRLAVRGAAPVGFVAAAFGFEPMWGLDDVKYEWVASGR